MHRPRGALGWMIDGPLIACGVLVGAWVPVNIDIIANQVFPRQIDVWVGVLTILVVLEAARRAVGLGMTIIGAASSPMPSRAAGASCPFWPTGCPAS
jgi:TRAP-type uncharacterized transport system fused permease subunit